MELIHELTPAEMSHRSGVAVSALHFYEREGLIASRRTSGNQRRYARETLRRVAFIRMSQRLGIPLARIREALASLPTDRVPTSKDWARLSAGWRADLDERIVHLQRLRDNLTGCIGCGCLSLRSEEHTSELQSHHPISYAVFCLKKKTEYLKTKQKGRDHEPVTSNDVYDTVAALEPLAEEQRISIFPFFF